MDYHIKHMTQLVRNISKTVIENLLGARLLTLADMFASKGRLSFQIRANLNETSESHLDLCVQAH